MEWKSFEQSKDSFCTFGVHPRGCKKRLMSFYW